MTATATQTLTTSGPDTPGRKSAATPKPAPGRKLSLRHRLRRDGALLLMVLPAVALLIVFAYVPMLGNVIAWLDYSPYVGIIDSVWIGWDNFARVFQNATFWHAVANTLTITAFQLVFYFPIPIILALLLNSVSTPWVRSTIQSIVYLPHFFSWVLVVTIFQQIFGGAGLLHRVLANAGFDGFDLMTNPDTFLVLITSQAVWKDAGWGIIIFLAALGTVNPEQYEAATMDGAGKWGRIWHVTLPAIRPTIILLLILRLGDALTVGFEQLILQRDAVGADTAEVLDTYSYYTGVIGGDWSMGAAAGLAKGVVGTILIVLANKVAHLLGEDGIYRGRPQ